MKKHVPLASATAVVVLAALLPAQAVTSQLSASTPIDVQCGWAALTDQATQPAGPLPSFGLLNAEVGSPVPLASAQANWETHDTPSSSLVILRHALFVDVSAPGFAIAGPCEFLVQFDAPTTVPIVMEARRTTDLSVGGSWPEVALDVGNDGSIDYPNLWTTGPVQLAVPNVGPGPRQVRIVFGSAVAAAGYSFTTVSLEVRPYNSLTITKSALGCGTAFLWPTEVFDGQGLVLDGDPGFLVFGLATQGILLQPPPFPAVIPYPCWLLPSPEVVLFFPGNLPLALPPAVRPVQFHLQNVFVSPGSGLWTTDGFTIDAF